MKPLLLLILFWVLGCSRSESNTAPEIVRALTDITIPRGGTLGFTFKMIEVIDRDADQLTLIVESGANYRANGTSITADPDFLGKILVKVSVHDGKTGSKPFYVEVNVIDYIAIMPLRTGNHWVYNDWDAKTGTTVQSKFIVDGPVEEGLFEGITYRCHWDNIDTLQLSVLLGNISSGGNYLLGAESPRDTLKQQAVRFKYPVKLGESWKYPVLQYSLSDTQYVLQEMNINCTDTARYISVPAGVFRCIEYSSEASFAINVFGRNKIVDRDYLSYSDGVRYTINNARTLKKYRLTYWYSPGIGCVAISYFIDDNLIEKKELVSFNVL